MPKLKKSTTNSNDNKSWEGVIIKNITFDIEDKKIIKAFNKKTPYNTLCEFISSRKDYCDTINEIWKNNGFSFSVFFISEYGLHECTNINSLHNLKLIDYKHSGKV